MDFFSVFAELFDLDCLDSKSWCYDTSPKGRHVTGHFKPKWALQWLPQVCAVVWECQPLCKCKITSLYFLMKGLFFSAWCKWQVQWDIRLLFLRNLLHCSQNRPTSVFSLSQSLILITSSDGCNLALYKHWLYIYYIYITDLTWLAAMPDLVLKWPLTG